MSALRGSRIPSAAVSDELVLEMRGIRKEFPGVVANDDVSLEVRRGEVHALLGENGAGKSTLMNILYGLYRADGGEIRLHGKPVSFASARDAIQAGIGMVHQHFMLIPVMTVAENVVLGTEPRRNGILLDEARAEARVADMARTFRFAVDPSARVDSISVGQQQRVEIMKALYRNADIVILDEPTAVLTPQEAIELFEILKNLVTEGMSVIFISHKLNEVLEIADRVTVLRRGKKVDTIPREGATEASLSASRRVRDFSDLPVVSPLLNSLLAQERATDHGDYVLLHTVTERLSSTPADMVTVRAAEVA